MRGAFGQASLITDLQARIGQLEQVVAQLRGVEGDVGVRPIPTPDFAPLEVTAEASTSVETPSTPPPQQIEWREIAERWLGRIGVVLVIFAAIFLFRYAIDQGWLTEVRRVIAGVVAGIALCATGWLLRNRRPALGRAMLGGGIATFYVSAWAAYSLYTLISLGIAFPIFIAITTLTIIFSFWQDDGSLALLAAFGGFLTPFLLSTGDGNALILAIYTAVLAGGLSFVFLAQRVAVTPANARVGRLASDHFCRQQHP